MTTVIAEIGINHNGSMKIAKKLEKSFSRTRNKKGQEIIFPDPLNLNFCIKVKINKKTASLITPLC